MAGLGPAIHVLLPSLAKDVDARHKVGMTRNESVMTTKKPRELPKRQPIKPRDAVTPKASASNANGPFATFSEWAGEADAKAYDDL